jgi:hypothetical protein
MMKTKQLLLIAAASLCLAGLTGTAYAQDDDDDGHVFSVSTYQWPFENLEEIFASMEEDKDIVEQNEYILSRKILTHEWAGNFSVMFIIEYASMEDIGKSQERANELFEAKYPDEEVREARGDRFTELTGHTMHVDNIVRENAALTK